jgi:U3 small nucleolar RNA-associated protein 10
MLGPCAGSLPLRPLFTGDDQYQTFSDKSVVPALTALALAVGRDIHWKPLNHKILLLARDPCEAVRLASLSALHRLFTEVGEEYLMLLPECIPFLSELMEDDSAAVTSQAHEVVRCIESLSGESLDAYLQ